MIDKRKLFLTRGLFPKDPNQRDLIINYLRGHKDTPQYPKLYQWYCVEAEEPITDRELGFRADVSEEKKPKVVEALKTEEKPSEEKKTPFLKRLLSND